MIHAENLTVHYPTGESPALDGVSFDVAAGDVLGVVGPVDSGKSTLAKAVAGFVPSVTGGILDGDLEVAGRDPRSGVDGTAAMVFEDYSSQLTQVRVRDEVIVPLLDRGLDRETAERRVEALLERVRLDGYATERTWELSGGEQQRVAIAAALATDPEVLVLDTATEMLDPEGRADVSNLISSLAGETTLVVTVEDAQELVGVADDVLVLDDGEPAAVGPAGDILRDYERFADRGINPPTCVTAAHELGLDGAPLTRDEFVAATEGIETPRRDRDRPQRAATDGAFGEPVACLDGVTFRYGDDVAIDDVDMTLGAGEVHAVVGGNGAGKTTLTRLLVGLESPDEGRVVVDGTDTSDASAAEVAESVGLAFQDADVQLGRATVEDEIRFPLEQRQHERSGLLPFRTEQRYDDAFVDERTETVLSLAGLEDVREADPTKLPQGDRRLTAIASAVAPDPDVLVLDEPTAGLDAAGYERVRRTIDRVRERGTAVLLVEHDMEFVCETADRVTLLNDGAVELAGPPADVFAREHWDALRRRYVRPPRGARLADHLDVDAFTVDELVAELGTREVDA